MEEHDYKAFPELTNSQMETESFNSPHHQFTEDFDATVVKVHDGDTVTLSSPLRDFDFPLRLLDIDSKELSDGGSEARNWLKEQIQGEEVLILINKKNRVGKYGRLLGKILSRGIDIGEAEIQAGLAVPFGKKKEGEPINLDKMFSLKQWF